MFIEDTFVDERSAAKKYPQHIKYPIIWAFVQHSPRKPTNFIRVDWESE